MMEIWGQGWRGACNGERVFGGNTGKVGERMTDPA